MKSDTNKINEIKFIIEERCWIIFMKCCVILVHFDVKLSGKARATFTRIHPPMQHTLLCNKSRVILGLCILFDWNSLFVSRLWKALRRGAGHYVQDWENTRGASYYAHSNTHRIVFFSLTRHHFWEYVKLLFTALHTAFSIDKLFTKFRYILWVSHSSIIFYSETIVTVLAG